MTTLRRVRLVGSGVTHRVPADQLQPDDRFGKWNGFLRPVAETAETACGLRKVAFVDDPHGEPCLKCDRAAT